MLMLTRATFAAVVDVSRFYR